MQFEIDCTWKQKTRRAKLVICRGFRPKSLFAMPEAKIRTLQQLSLEAKRGKSSALFDLQTLKASYPKSVYAAFVLLLTYQAIGDQESAKQVFLDLVKQFPNEVITRCLQAGKTLRETNYDKFFEDFQGEEVLKGSFPKRRVFFIEEALLFHNLWVQYYDIKGQPTLSEKHKQFIALLLQR